MIDFALTEDQLSVQEMARRFAEREIRPLAERLDRSQHLLDDFPWPLVQKGSEVGLRTAALPVELDGPDFDLRTCVVLIDELGYPDASCARIFSQNWNLCRAIARHGTPAQKERFLCAFRDDDRFLLSGDGAASKSGGRGRPDAGQASNGDFLRATRVGDRYVLNGRKRSMPLAPKARLLLVDAHVGVGAGAVEESGSFLVPGDSKGITLASLDDTVGLRMQVPGTLVFDNVEVPAENVLGGGSASAFDEVLCAAGSVEVSAHAMALARAALDAATKYATERIQGGKRIIEHQAVALALADMYIAFQAGRSLVWRVAWTADDGKPDRALSMACKVFCTETAVRICRDAVELFGGSGVMRELPLQKYFRDSLVLLHMEGTNHGSRAGIESILSSRTEEGVLPQ